MRLLLTALFVLGAIIAPVSGQADPGLQDEALLTCMAQERENAVLYAATGMINLPYPTCADRLSGTCDADADLAACQAAAAAHLIATSDRLAGALDEAAYLTAVESLPAGQRTGALVALAALEPVNTDCTGVEEMTVGFATLTGAEVCAHLIALARYTDAQRATIWAERMKLRP